MTYTQYSKHGATANLCVHFLHTISDLSVMNGIAWVNPSTLVAVNGEADVLVVDMVKNEITSKHKDVAALKYARYVILVSN